MNQNILPSNRAVLASVVDPDAYAPATLTSGWVSLVDFGSILAIIAWGTLGSGATINAKLEQASDASGTGVKDISGKAITEVDVTDSPEPHDQQALINCRADELDVDNDFTHVRLSITSTDSNSPQEGSDVAGFVLGLDAKYQPEADAATVAEVIS